VTVDIPEPEHVNIGEHLTRVVTAAEAVREGIATHVEKHRVAREEHQAKLEAQRKLEHASISQT
jgi:hypothetical protein